MNGSNRSKLDAQRRSFLRGTVGHGVAVCTLSLTPAGKLAAQLFPHPDRPIIVIPRQIGKRYYEIEIKYDQVLNDDPPRVLIPHSAVRVSVLGSRGWSSPSPLSSQHWDKRRDLENLRFTIFETPGNDGRRYAEDVGQSVAIKLTLNLEGALRTGRTLPENAHWDIRGVNMDFRGIRTEEIGKLSLPRSKLSANTPVEWIFTPTGATQRLRSDYPTSIPELADIKPDNALKLINRSSVDIFGPAAHVDEEVAILQSITSSKAGVSNVGFSKLFISPNVETSRLNGILNSFESSNITQQNLVASLRNWTEYRANTISLFSRLNSYFAELENDWDFEYEKIVVMFRRPLRVITTAAPQPADSEDDATYYIGLALAFMTGVPHPLPVIAGVVGTIAISLIDKYNEEPTMQPMQVITPVTGGSTPYVEQLRDQFHQLGIYFRHLFEGLERTALQSYAMMIQCSESETDILNSPQLLSGPKKPATLPTDVVPARSALLKELMRDVWEKLIPNELIVKNIYPNVGKQEEPSTTYLGSLAGYNGTYDLGNIRFHLFLAGPVAARPAENATLVPPELIERIHWLFDTTEILNLLCNARRAYVTYDDDDLPGKVYTSDISNLGWFVFWPEIMRRISQRDKYGKMTVSNLGSWKTWAHQGSNAPWVYPGNCSGSQFLECEKHTPPNKYAHVAPRRGKKKLVPIPGT